MTTVNIEARGCRDCSLCQEICPTHVFERMDAGMAAPRQADCIGCASCVQICPSRCVSLGGHQPPRPYHRIQQSSRIIERMLRTQPVESAIPEADLDGALKDVRVRLFALGESVTETMGRGVKAVGRKAGTLAAGHLPDLYEGRDLDDVLVRLSDRFKGSFQFEASLDADKNQVTLTFPHCAVATAVRAGGQKVGDGVLCQLFHEYWAGLVGAFTGKSYAVELLEAQETCRIRLSVRG